MSALRWGIETFFQTRFKRQFLGRGRNCTTREAMLTALMGVWIMRFQNYPKLNPARWWLRVGVAP